MSGGLINKEISCVWFWTQVPPNTRNASVDELKKLSSKYSRPDKFMSRSTRYVIDELAASSVYSVAIRTRNSFGFSDWTPEYYFETAPGTVPMLISQYSLRRNTSNLFSVRRVRFRAHGSGRCRIGQIHFLSGWRIRRLNHVALILLGLVLCAYA